MNRADRIEINPKICVGKPCIHGSRIPVDKILSLLAAGWSYDELQKEFLIELEDIFAVLDYAAKMLEEEKVYKMPIEMLQE